MFLTDRELERTRQFLMDYIDNFTVPQKMPAEQAIELMDLLRNDLAERIETLREENDI